MVGGVLSGDRSCAVVTIFAENEYTTWSRSCLAGSGSVEGTGTRSILRRGVRASIGRAREAAVAPRGWSGLGFGGGGGVRRRVES